LIKISEESSIKELIIDNCDFLENQGVSSLLPSLAEKQPFLLSTSKYKFWIHIFQCNFGENNDE
jgi:hypothetical protein